MRILTIIAFLSVFFTSCAEKQPPETPLLPPESGAIQTAMEFPDSVMAFGVASSSRPEIAEEKARLSARGNINGMAGGIQFHYSASGQKLRSQSQGLPRESDESVYRWVDGGRNFAMVLTRTAMDSALQEKPQFFVRDTLSGNNLDKALITAISDHLQTLLPEADSISGRYWISDVRFVPPQDGQDQMLALTIWLNSHMANHLP